ncbi:unnamed protein product [Blepharisma stoltei]|uniref:CDC20/Fizzy WD40 domain-containing protein n=1 Tax=Blepharisma stoltei TaxID=1481888 RepID=A0AAU9JVG7_9CILI|nr:unnamed protein product [Blepharisma stoltei]
MKPLITPKLSNADQKFSERFLPNRASSNLQVSFDLIKDEKFQQSQDPVADDSQEGYTTLLKNQFLDHSASKNNRFTYSQNTLTKENMPLNFSGEDIYTPLKSQRNIPKAPFKVLDAPSLQDDFYLNLLDWSSNNVLGVGLGSSVYLWNASTSKVTKLCDLGSMDPVTSVSWSPNGNYISIGTNTGSTLLWDSNRLKLIRSFSGHSSRVGAMAWSNKILSTGSRDRQILHRDIRCPEEFVGRLIGHKQEVCGLKWSFDDQQLSSGGNDNKLILWSLQSTSPMAKFNEHIAAVKAIAWSPHQHGLLASGGGTADRTIRFWNTLTNEQLQCVDTGSQVCNLMFSKNSDEIVSTHGYSQNQIMLWQYPGLRKIATLTGHTFRVLYLCMSPDGQTVVTGAGDETLRFWDLFPGNKESCEIGQKTALFPCAFDLR